MTELNNDPSPPANGKEQLEKTSPWIMLTSMSLLIFGLLLASVMLINRAQEKRGNTSTALFDLSGFINKGKTLSGQVKAKVAEKNEEQATADEPKVKTESKTGLTRFFSGMRNGAVRWPKLKLTGFGKSSDGESGFAIINEKHIIVGQKISKVTLVEIGAHSVVVEYKDDRKILTVDSSK